MAREASHEEVDAQIGVLCKHPLLQGDLRPHLLRFLVRIKREGRYDGHPRPIGKQILAEFYEHAVNEFRIARPKDPDLTGKKLVADLAGALEKYYDSHRGPGAGDRIVIRIAAGRGPGYEPSIEARPELHSTPAAHQHDAQEDRKHVA